MRVKMMTWCLAGTLTLLLAGAGMSRPTSPISAPQEAQADTQQAQGRQSWTGALVDADCKMQNPAQACPARESTTTFGIALASGEFARFDAAGNEKAKSAIAKSGKKDNLSATVTGTVEGDMLKVESIKVH